MVLFAALSEGDDVVARAFYDCDEAMVVTNSSLSQPKEIAATVAVHLVDREGLQT